MCFLSISAFDLKEVKGMVTPIAKMRKKRIREGGGGNILKIGFTEVAALVDIWIQP